MLRLTQKGLTTLKTIEELSEKDIRLLGFIAYEETAIEKSFEGAEWVGYVKEEIRRLQKQGYIKS